jgi:hemerythrin-like domain-containing protein
MTAEIDIEVGEPPLPSDGPARASVVVGTDQIDLDPITVICDDHTLQLELCNILEFIADGLPDVSNQALIDLAISILQRAWPTHVALEEQYLFPMLRSRLADSEMTLGILDQLEHEHATDEDVAREVIFALEALQSTSDQFDAAAAGYLLRSFFESQRRHITWENSTVLPLARKVLSAEDLAAMRAAIAASDGPRRVREAFAALRAANFGCRGCGECTCRGNG